MDYYAVLEALDQDQLVGRNRSLTLLSGESGRYPVNLTLLKKALGYNSIGEESAGTSNFFGNVDLDRNHISLPSGNGSQAWRGRLHLDMILFLIDREHLPGLTVEDEFCSACASAGDEVLVEASDPPFPEEIEHGILLNIRYDREVCEVVLNRLWVTRGKELVELSQQSKLNELRDNTTEFYWIDLAERVRAMNDLADLLNRHSTLLE